MDMLNILYDVTDHIIWCSFCNYCFCLLLLSTDLWSIYSLWWCNEQLLCVSVSVSEKVAVGSRSLVS